jgi:predicted O-methyltransferase YrrM
VQMMEKLMPDQNKTSSHMFDFWRERIRELYGKVRQSQATKLLPLKDLLLSSNYEKVEGSLISPHSLDRPEADGEIYMDKRLNYVFLMNYLQPQTALEIGFNWGYSASLILESRLSCSLRSIDIAHHWYTKPCGELIERIYPGRFSSIWKDSHTALREERLAGRKYDMIFVDGGHTYEVASMDIVLSLDLLSPGGLLIVDDTDAPSVRAAVLATVARDERMIELTSENIGVFEFLNIEFACYEQRYFLKRRLPEEWKRE